MPKDKEIDWDDPKAVAAARGDDPDAGEETEDESAKETDEETKTGEEKEVLDKEEGKEEEEENKEPMLPKSRYDQKAAENRQLKERLAKLEKEKESEKKQEEAADARTQIQTEIDDLDKQMLKAIADDEMDKAAELRKDIRAKEQDMWKLDLKDSAETTTDEARESVRLDLTIDHIESTYPQFNPEDKEHYSQEVVDKVQELRTGFEATGKYTQTQALLRAMDYVLPKKDMNKVEDAAADDKKVEKETERRKEALEKATDAANKQPAKAGSLGDDADKAGLNEELNVDKLTYEDVAKLPKSTLSRLRGDNYS